MSESRISGLLGAVSRSLSNSAARAPQPSQHAGTASSGTPGRARAADAPSLAVVPADPQAAALEARRALAEHLVKAEAIANAKHSEAAELHRKAEAETNAAKVAFESAIKRESDAAFARSMIYTTYVTPLQAMRDELQRSAPPEIHDAIEDLYVRCGEKHKLARYEHRKDPDDISGKTTSVLQNGPELARYEKQCRDAITQLELLRWRFSEDIASDIAAIFATVHKP